MKTKVGNLFIAFLVLSVNMINGQIQITSGEEVSPEDLVENIVGEGVQFSNVQYQGAELAKGIFTNGYSTNIGIESGFILCTGYTSILQGPNFQTGSTGNNGTPGDATLTAICGQTTYDAAVLKFDLFPESDTLYLKYVFGSEEYPEYVLHLFNDVFGFFITGPNPQGEDYLEKNIAIIPGSDPELPVSIHNINNVIPSYPEFYVDNTYGLTIEYDGFTTVMEAWVKVIPCELYSVKIAIADASDNILDSGVALEAHTIGGAPIIEVETISSNPEISENMVEGCVEMDVIFHLPNASYAPTTVEFEIVEGSGYAMNGVDYIETGGNFLEPFVTFEEGEDSVVLHLVPVMDYMPEGDELITIIIENTLGCEVRYDTVSFIISDYTIMTDTITPPFVVCQCQDSVSLGIQVFNGMPPYSYLWEPGGNTTDTILIDPDTTTIYTVTYTDQCQETGSDSTMVTVFPFADLESFYFEALLNPNLSFDIYGEILEDTVMVLLPPGTNPVGLIASLTTSMEWMMILVDDEYQELGVTPNDFTNPVIYDIWSPGGHHSLWTVIAEVEVGQKEIAQSDIQIFPNPAREQLNILNANGYKVSLITNLGIEVYSTKIEKEDQTIDINHLEPGIYYLRFENEEEELVRKIMIDK